MSAKSLIDKDLQKIGVSKLGLTMAYKGVYPLRDGRLLAVAKYPRPEEDTPQLFIATLWDTSGRFLGGLVRPDSAWSGFQFFSASPLFSMTNGDTLLAVDAFTFKCYLFSLADGQVLDTFSVSIKGYKKFSPPPKDAC